MPPEVEQRGWSRFASIESTVSVASTGTESIGILQDVTDGE